MISFPHKKYMKNIKNRILFSLAFLVIILIVSCNASSGNAVTKTPAEVTTSNEINFIESDWNAALNKAKKENKLVFLDISASWCGPCKLLKRNTFTDPAVAEFFNTNFVNVAIDGEIGVGPELANTYQIQGYPTLIVADATGKSLLYTVGYIEPNDLLAFGKDALKKK